MHSTGKLAKDLRPFPEERTLTETWDDCAGVYCKGHCRGHWIVKSATSHQTAQPGRQVLETRPDMPLKAFKHCTQACQVPT